MKIRFPGAKFPDAKYRSDLVSKAEEQGCERRVAQDIVSGMLTPINIYTLNIYDTRDAAVLLIQQGKSVDAINLLRTIGEVK